MMEPLPFAVVDKVLDPDQFGSAAVHDTLLRQGEAVTSFATVVHQLTQLMNTFHQHQSSIGRSKTLLSNQESARGH